ncbi:MAG TPA: alpha/beta hydrolase [Steroidobacteraceae bacterium]|nr:alpha/beta hydrolase [Steroidobacteraceae bacterium]
MGQALDDFIQVRGARLRVRTAGAGAAVLLIHGWTLDLDMWTPQFAALADRYRLIAFDRRGFGLSTGTPGVERDLADIEALLAQLSIEQIAIVGMSQGARVALRWAMRFPQRTTCLILDGPPHDLLASGRSDGEIAFAQYRELVRREGIEEFRRQWLEHPLMRLHTHDVRTRALLRRMVNCYPGRDLLADEAERLPAAGDLTQLDLPVLVINGVHDSAARIGAGAELARMLPDVRRAAIPAAGHLANLDNPGAYNAALGEFLASEYASCRAE